MVAQHPPAIPTSLVGGTTNANSHHMSSFNHSLFSLLKNPPFSSTLSKSPINLTATKTQSFLYKIQQKNPPRSAIPESFLAAEVSAHIVLKSESIFPEQMEPQGTREIPVRVSPPVYNPLLIVAMRVGRGPGRCRAHTIILSPA